MPYDKSGYLKLSALVFVLLPFQVYFGTTLDLVKNEAFADSGYQLIDEVLINEKSKCAEVTIAFNYPVRYDRHFPSKTGDDLRIKISFLGVAGEDKEFLFQHESVRPPPNKIPALSEVNFEGDVEGGPYLNLFFSKKVAFMIRESSKNRAITVFVSNIGEESFCVLQGDL